MNMQTYGTVKKMGIITPYTKYKDDKQARKYIKIDFRE